MTDTFLAEAQMWVWLWLAAGLVFTPVLYAFRIQEGVDVVYESPKFDFDTEMRESNERTEPKKFRRIIQLSPACTPMPSVRWWGYKKTTLHWTELALQTALHPLDSSTTLGFPQTHRVGERPEGALRCASHGDDGKVCSGGGQAKVRASNGEPIGSRGADEVQRSGRAPGGDAASARPAITEGRWAIMTAVEARCRYHLLLAREAGLAPMRRIL